MIDMLVNYRGTHVLEATVKLQSNMANCDFS